MDRRDFLHTATIGAAVGVAPHANAQDADEHDHQAPPSDLTLRVKALESLLVEKGLVDPAALDAIVERSRHKIGPRNGARVVARAWVDPDYKRAAARECTRAAIAELGYTSGQGEHMVAIENSAKVHNLVVCTLCSCYPWAMLGLPPVWYKSHRTDRAPSSIRAGCCASSARSSTRTSKCACGTARRSCATS